MTAEGSSILIVAADADLGCASMGRLAADGYRVEWAADVAEASERMEALAPDLVLVDLELPDLNGVELVQRARALDAGTALLIVTSPALVPLALDALEAGAADYLQKPVNPAELQLLVARCLDDRRLLRELRILRNRFPERHPFPEIVGDAPAMQEILETLVQISTGRRNVLLIGEVGTGKSLVARAIHRRSPGGGRELLTIPCQSVSERALDVRLEHAFGATVLLEQVDQSPAALQARLLRLLDDLDLRLLAESSQDLRAVVQSGRFRDDLHQRLAEVSLRLPPLRDRSSDVPALAMNFLARHAVSIGKAVAGFDREALGRLCAHHWSGNVRELDRVVERAVAQASGPRITVADLPAELQALSGPPGIRVPGSTLAALERHAILETLRATGGSTGKAARVLGISVRNVQYKVRAYGWGQASDLRGQRAAGEKVA